MNRLILLAALVWPCVASSQNFQSTNDIVVTGQTGIQTFDPQARLQIQISTSNVYALKVSSSDMTPLAVVDSSGRLGIATLSPQALVDVPGSGDTGKTALWLRSGNSTSTTLSSQIVFAAPGGLYPASIGTRHTNGQTYDNAVDFFLWNSTAQPSALGAENALTIQESVAGASSASVHVDPYGEPTVELEVSNGSVLGGGSILRAAAGVHMSSREAKTDIQYLTEADEKTAYDDVKALRPARFRFKTPPGRPRQPLRRGLIYEDSPASIQGRGHAIVFDNRLANLELALKEINRRIAAVQSKIDSLEQQKKLKVRGGQP
jgi:hypothetical protein